MQTAKDIFILIMRKILLFLLLFILPINLSAITNIDVLSDTDAETYSQIFILQDKEKIDSAKKLESKLSDSLLMNEVLYQRFISKTYHTRGVELQNWLNAYYDMNT